MSRGARTPCRTPHQGLRGTRNPGETFGRASMTRIACSERGLAVFGASFSASLLEVIVGLSWSIEASRGVSFERFTPGGLRIFPELWKDCCRPERRQDETIRLRYSISITTFFDRRAVDPPMFLRLPIRKPRVVKTNPLSSGRNVRHSAHVLAGDSPTERRQRTPLLERRGEPPRARRAHGATDGALSGRDQRCPARPLVSHDRDARRRSPGPTGVVPRGSAATARLCRGAGPAGPPGVGPPPPVGRLLAGAGNSGGNWTWTGSGRSGCRRRAKGRAG